MIRGDRQSGLVWAVMAIGIGSLILGAPGRAADSTPADGTRVSADSEESLLPPSHEKCLSPVGPALAVPRELLDLLNQRKQALDRREEAVRGAETRLKTLKDDMEGTLARYELAVKTAEAKRQDAKKKQTQAEQTAYQNTLVQVVKMYETMPPEDAAVRIEKVPNEMALQVLRSLKGKTAGAILALVKPDKAAKLTEQLMAASTRKISPDR